MTDVQAGQRFMRLGRALALAGAGVGACWTIALILFGGGEYLVFGRRLATHDPVRPLFLTCLAAVLYVALGGAVRIPPRLTSLARQLETRMGWLAIALAAVVFVLGMTFGTMAVGGSDSYGYLSQTDLWLAGNLKVPQPWAVGAPWHNARATFAPLGYRPIDNDPEFRIVPTYSPGYPLLMAGAKAVAGHCAAFVVGPVGGAVMVLATFGIGRRLGSSLLGLLAALFLATSPVFLHMLMAPMSDVVGAGLWAAAAYFLLGRSTWSAAMAGLLSALAILVRPNLFVLAAVMGGWLAIAAWRNHGPARRRALLQLGMYALGSGPGVAAVALINQWRYGSAGTSGYGRFSDLFAWSHVWPNLFTYTWWFVDSQSTVALAGIVALAVPLKALWPASVDRSLVPLGAALVATILAMYFSFMVLDLWWDLRLLLPVWPFIMLGLASVVVVALQSRQRLVVVVGVSAVLLLSVRGWAFAASHGSFTLWKSDRRFPAAAELADTMTDRNSVVFSMIHSGSIRYYGGRVSIRYDLIAPEEFDRVIAWFDDHRAHPYALLDDWELGEVKRRFAGDEALAAFEAPPVFEYRGEGGTTYFYDLSRSADSSRSVVTVLESYHGRRCATPGPQPALALKE